MLFAVDAEEELAEHQETVDEKLAKLKNEIFMNNRKMMKKIIDHITEDKEQIIKAVRGEIDHPEHAAIGHGSHAATHGHGHH